jgi:hypothetical protein
MCPTLVTPGRLHALAAHGHASADFREADTCAKRFHQQPALMRAMAVAQTAEEFNHRDLVIFQSRDRIVHKPRSAHPKITFLAIRLNPMAIILPCTRGQLQRSYAH